MQSFSPHWQPVCTSVGATKLKKEKKKKEKNKKKRERKKCNRLARSIHQLPHLGPGLDVFSRFSRRHVGGGVALCRFYEALKNRPRRLPSPPPSPSLFLERPLRPFALGLVVHACIPLSPDARSQLFVESPLLDKVLCPFRALDGCPLRGHRRVASRRVLPLCPMGSGRPSRLLSPHEKTRVQLCKSSCCHARRPGCRCWIYERENATISLVLCSRANLVKPLPLLPLRPFLLLSSFLPPRYLRLSFSFSFLPRCILFLASGGAPSGRYTHPTESYCLRTPFGFTDSIKNPAIVYLLFYIGSWNFRSSEELREIRAERIKTWTEGRPIITRVTVKLNLLKKKSDGRFYIS